MNNSKSKHRISKLSNKGFTLMEIVVGINLGFILLTVLVTFFLFSTKFISTTTKNLENRHTATDFLLRLNNKFKKSHSFYFEQLDSNYLCVLDNVDTISFSKKTFLINGFYKLDNITSYNLDIVFTDFYEDATNFSSKAGSKSNSDNKIISSDIATINIEMEFNKLNYKLSFKNRDISVKRFRNIRDD